MKPTSSGLRDLIDGSSSTISHVEAITGDYNNLRAPWRMMASGVGVPANFMVRDARQIMPIYLQAARSCVTTMRTAPGSNSNRGARWQTGSPGLSLTNIIITPNSTDFQFSACRLDCSAGCGTDFGHIFVPTSFHSGGVNVLFGDGSVRFVKNTVNQQTWMSLGTRDMAEVVSSDAY